MPALFLLAATALFFPAVTSAQSYEVLHAFGLSGAHPFAGLIQATDGNFYGTTSAGGSGGYGTVFKMDSAGNLTRLHDFVGPPNDGAIPFGTLIQATDGNFYGTTDQGGASNVGTVFKMDSAGNVTTLHSFAGSDGTNPRGTLIQATDGNFYGTTDQGGASSVGTVFKMDSAGNVTTLHSFTGTPSDGAYPIAGVIQATDGNFFGTTSAGGYSSGDGTVFKMDSSGNVTILHNFAGYPSDGAGPLAGLIQATDGNFYGTTQNGGVSSYGTVFKMDSSGNLTTLHDFAGPPNDGANPYYVRLIQATDGNFYGTTYYGGAGDGTVFKMDSSGNLTTLHSFETDGATPWAGLTQATDGNFYGTTYYGGAGDGTVFKMDSSGNLTIFHGFAGSDGYYPAAALIQATDGGFYGTTVYGGSGVGVGTIFKIDSSGNLTTLHSFTGGSDGTYPYAGLIQATDGNFYGTTSVGGAGGYGTIFKIDSSGNLTTLHGFASSDGASPYAGLIQATDSNFYGTTTYGGASNGGTVFKIDSSGSLTTLHSFDGATGYYPRAGLLQASDGNFYGTTEYGGSGTCPSGCGTVFKVDSTGNMTILHNFAGYPSDGASSLAGLIQLVDGNFYGTTFSGGSADHGTVFRMDSAGNVTTLYSLTGGSGGANPLAGLILATDGNFYGTTTYGGGGSCSGGCGVVFRLTICSPPTAVASGTATICVAGSAPLSGSGGVSCSWTPAAGLDNPNSCTPLASPSATTTYTLTVTDASGCSSINNPTVAVTVDLPTATVSGSTSICQGASATIHAALTGTSPWSLTWSDGFTQTVTSSPANRSVSPASTTTYTVTAVSDANCAGTSSGSATVTVNPLPIASASGSATICAGQSTPLSGSGGFSCFWTPATGLSNVHTCSPTASPANTTTYTLTVMDVHGCVSTNNPTVTVTVNPVPAPVITVGHCVAPSSSGLMASVPANAGDTYNWTIVGGTIDSGQGTNAISLTSGSPGTQMTLSVDETSPASCVGTAADALQVDFNDVPSGDPFYNFVCAIGRDGITAGCGAGNYCPNSPVTRAQMAVFLLKAEHGANYTPPACKGIFADVECTPTPAFAVDWIEQLSSEGITGGCGGGNYCPNDPVTRAQMAVFLLRAQHGPGYTPPVCHGVFADVPCPGGFAVDWIEQVSTEGITGGCGGGNYCPDSPNTRAQMAVFLTETFKLQ